MVTNFNELYKLAKTKGNVRVAVINPVDEVSLGGALSIATENLGEPILFGEKKSIEKTAEQYSLDISSYTIINCKNEAETIQHSINYCREKKADVLMKGKVHTDHLMSAVIKRETGLRTSSQISSVFVLSLPSYHKLLFITDCAINITPNLETKEKIIINALDLMGNIGIEKPKVACLSAVESVNDKILGSVEASALSKNINLQSRCIIEGPLAFDNVISKKAADIKGIKSDIAGEVDLILVPNLEVGNVLFKSLVYLAGAQVAGVVLGASVPIILTSRADGAKARLMSAVLACLSNK